MRNIPIVTKNLLIINILVFIATYVLRGLNIDLNDILGLHFFLASDFRIWQFFTYMFMHGGFTHILMNMFMLWMFGMVVENVWGPKKFLFYYIVCGVGAGLCQELAQYGTYLASGMAQLEFIPIGPKVYPIDAYLNMIYTVGASGAIYGVLLAFGMLFPEERMFIIPIPIPIKAKWIVMGSIVVELFSAIGTSNDGVAHLAHLGGMLFGFILIRYWKKHPYSGYGDFGMNRGHQFFDRMKNTWEQRGGRDTGNTTNGNSGSWSNTSQSNNANNRSDWDYNAQKKQQQEEVDRILDKIRKSGYDSLTKDEKQKLFDSSKS